MSYRFAVCTVKNCWWWTDELSETCRVLFQNKLEKSVHPVGFIIRTDIHISMLHTQFLAHSSHLHYGLKKLPKNIHPQTVRGAVQLAPVMCSLTTQIHWLGMLLYECKWNYTDLRGKKYLHYNKMRIQKFQMQHGFLVIFVRTRMFCSNRTHSALCYRLLQYRVPTVNTACSILRAPSL